MKFTNLSAMAFAIAAFGLGGSALAQIVLKSADVHPPGYPTVVAVENMGKKLSEATSGRLSIQVYPVDAARRREGIPRADAVRRALPSPASASASWARSRRELNVFNLPFVFRDRPHAQCRRRPARRRDAAGDHRPSDRQPHRTGVDGWRHAQPLQRQGAGREDGGYRGLKIRVMGNPIFVDMMNAIGGNGVVDGHGPAHERSADRRGRRRGEQLSDLRHAAALQLRQVLFADRAPDHP